MSVTTDETPVAAIAAQLRKEAAQIRTVAEKCRAKDPGGEMFYAGMDCAARTLEQRADAADEYGYLI